MMTACGMNRTEYANILGGRGVALVMLNLAVRIITTGLMSVKFRAKKRGKIYAYKLYIYIYIDGHEVDV
jgi:hypothetical protein